MDVHWSNRRESRTDSRQVEQRILAAVAEERQRLASELHDSIGGTLSGVAMGLAALEGSARDADSREKLAGLAHAVAQGLAEIRTFSFALQLPWSEPETSFETAVAHFAAGFGRRTGMAVTLDVAPSAGALENGQGLALMRVLQEALLNAHRHARANSVRVYFRSDDDAAWLAIQDDGCGMDMVDGTPPSGAGLVSMRDRIRAVGGVLGIESGAGGTTVSVCLPLRSAKRTSSHSRPA